MAMSMVYQWLFWLVAVLTALRLLIAILNNNSALRLPLQQRPSSLPKVSILIPASNEAKRLPELLAQLSTLELPQLEWLVYND